MALLDELIAKRAKVHADIQELGARPVDTATGLRTADVTASLEKALPELTTLNSAIDQERSLVAAEAESRKITERAPETRAPEADDAKALAARETRAFHEYVARGLHRMSPEAQATYAAQEARAQATTPDAAGGFLIPDTYRPQITNARKLISRFSEEATTIRTAGGGPLEWPSHDGTAQVGSIVGENVAITDLDFTFGTKALPAFMYTSGIVKVSRQLLTDSVFDLGPWIGTEFGNRLARVQNLHFTIGTGTGQPLGVVPGAGVGVTAATGNTTAITYANLVALKHSVDPAYRANAKWMMSDAALRTISLLVDTQGRPLWQPALTLGAPDVLLGHEVIVNQDVPVPAANARSVLFGDYRAGYVIREVEGTTLLRLDERYAELLQTAFLAFTRKGGTVDDVAAVKAYVHSAT